jgi:hypothetical protein
MRRKLRRSQARMIRNRVLETGIVFCVLLGIYGGSTMGWSVGESLIVSIAGMFTIAIMFSKVR